MVCLKLLISSLLSLLDGNMSCPGKSLQGNGYLGREYQSYGTEVRKYSQGPCCMQDDVRVANSLKEAADIHDSPTILAFHVTKIEGSLEDENKRYKVASNYIEEKTRQVNKHQKALLQETKSNAKALKSLQDEVANMKYALRDSLERTMWDVIGVHEKVMDHTRRFYPDAVISIEVLDLFKSASGVTQGGCPSTSTSDVSS